MKKSLLLIIALAGIIDVHAQSTSRLPQGFKRGEIPAAIKNQSIKVNVNDRQKDSGIPFNNPINTRFASPQPNTLSASFISEYLVGYSFYDLQTNNSISNRIVRNDDGSYAVSWTYSPTYDTPEAFPNRGTGYNYSPDGDTWLYPGVPGTPGPTARIESTRTGFTNIVNTSSGSEVVVAHTSTSMSVSYRAAKGTGAWSISYPWGTNNTDTWSKAIAGGNNSVYVIFQGIGVATTPLLGQKGPLFFSKSTDGGLTWTPKSQIPGTDSTEYLGFGGDDYAIDAKGNTVAIVLGNQLTDLMLLKSTDGGNNWTRTFVYKNPLTMFNIDGTQISDTNADGIVDTLTGPGGDNAVLIDENNLCHVWFCDFRWYCDASTAGSYNYFPSTDGLEYWNENMGQNGYVLIAEAEDLNGNGVLDVPQDATCSLAWGTYGGGLTGMPSAGLGSDGTIFVSYQTIDELADTAQYHQAHRHVYIITSPDKGLTWTYPYDIVPSIADGGDGENQEAVYAALPKSVGADLAVLYQRDGAPGNALAATTTCDNDFNSGNSSDIVFARYDIASIVGVKSITSNDVFITQGYPNPTTGMAYFNVSTKTGSDMNITVTNLLGEVIYSEIRKNVPAGVSTISLNTSNWSKGLYTYNVTSNNQNASKRIVVQ